VLRLKIKNIIKISLSNKEAGGENVFEDSKQKY
jgi:hypothetical protein